MTKRKRSRALDEVDRRGGRGCGVEGSLAQKSGGEFDSEGEHGEGWGSEYVDDGDAGFMPPISSEEDLVFFQKNQTTPMVGRRGEEPGTYYRHISLNIFEDVPVPVPHWAKSIDRSSRRWSKLDSAWIKRNVWDPDRSFLDMNGPVDDGAAGCRYDCTYNGSTSFVVWVRGGRDDSPGTNVLRGSHSLHGEYKVLGGVKGAGTVEAVSVFRVPKSKIVSREQLEEEQSLSQAGADRSQRTVYQENAMTIDSPKRVFIGQDHEILGACGTDPINDFLFRHYLGNTVLIRVKRRKYIFIGDRLLSFSLPNKRERIQRFYSLVGNSGVPLPVGVSGRAVYFFTHEGIKCAPICAIKPKIAPLMFSAYPPNLRKLNLFGGWDGKMEWRAERVRALRADEPNLFSTTVPWSDSHRFLEGHDAVPVELISSEEVDSLSRPPKGK